MAWTSEELRTTLISVTSTLSFLSFSDGQCRKTTFIPSSSFRVGSYGHEPKESRHKLFHIFSFWPQNPWDPVWVHVYDHCPTEVSTFNLTVAFQVQWVLKCLCHSSNRMWKHSLTPASLIGWFDTRLCLSHVWANWISLQGWKHDLLKKIGGYFPPLCDIDQLNVYWIYLKN